MIIEVKGDLLSHPEVQVIAHCANCFHTMGAGIAKQIKLKYPSAYEADKKTPYGDINKLGTYSWSDVGGKQGESVKIVTNVYGQYRYGREKRHLNYEAIYKGMESVRNHFHTFNIGIIYKMGCRNAGGDWHIIWAMMESLFADSDTNLFIIDNE
jgi:O-acetyl-ADP-ribose deacetylase (regulator of RNase III)